MECTEEIKHLKRCVGATVLHFFIIILVKHLSQMLDKNNNAKMQNCIKLYLTAKLGMLFVVCEITG